MDNYRDWYTDKIAEDYQKKADAAKQQANAGK